MWDSIVDVCENQLIPRMEEIYLVISTIFPILFLIILFSGFGALLLAWVYFKIRELVEDNKPENSIASVKLVKVEKELQEARKELAEWERSPHYKMHQMKERRSLK